MLSTVVPIERLRVAHALSDLPKISEKFSQGAISYSKVRAITRVANESNEDYLLMIAHHGTAHHVERLVAQYRRAKKLQDAEFANDLHLKREVTYYYDHDGCLVMKARIPADQGELIVKALEMAIEENHVTAETPAAKWYAGEQMDWEHAVWLMFASTKPSGAPVPPVDC